MKKITKAQYEAAVKTVTDYKKQRQERLYNFVIFIDEDKQGKIKEIVANILNIACIKVKKYLDKKRDKGHIVEIDHESGNVDSFFDISDSCLKDYVK